MRKKSKNFKTWYQAWCLMENSGAWRALGCVSAQNGGCFPAEDELPSRRWLLVAKPFNIFFYLFTALARFYHSQSIYNIVLYCFILAIYSISVLIVRFY